MVKLIKAKNNPLTWRAVNIQHNINSGKADMMLSVLLLLVALITTFSKVHNLKKRERERHVSP